MKKLGYALLLMAVFMALPVLGGMTLSQPEKVYNLGDRLYVSADGLRGSDSGNLDIHLVCGNRTTNLLRLSARAFSTTEDHTYSIPYKILNEEDLGIANLSDVLGNCQVAASMGAQFSSTNTFKITNQIMVSASLDKTNYGPGEGIRVDIDALKVNGELLEGFVEGANATAFNKAVIKGFASETFSLSETTEAGEYSLDIRVYDVGKNGVLNEGTTSVIFNINQVVSSISTSLSNLEAQPGSDFTMGVQIFDQSGKEMDGTIPVRVISPSKEVIELAIAAQDFATINFPSNASVGTWQIVSTFGDIGEEKEFEMMGVQKVEFEIEEGLLSVKNVGNIKYNKTITVKIGDDELILDLEMEVGEVRKFNLAAPRGEYKVVIGDGESSMSQQVLLTGNAISIKNLESVGIFKSYSVVWIFLIIVLGCVGVVLFFRYRKTKTLEEPSRINRGVDGIKSGISSIKSTIQSKLPSKYKSAVSDSLNYTKKSPSVLGLDHSSYSHEDKTMIDLTNKKIGSAESTLVLKGEKYQSSVISISIKNYDLLKDAAKSELARIVQGTKDSKGLVDWKGDHIVVVFSPIATRTYTNESLAVKEGAKILKELEIYNKKFKDKIEFNLGVHAGELVASKVGVKLKYTSIGNTISLAKRISDSDSGKLLISEVVRKKLLREVKAVKVNEIGTNQIYEISEILDKAANAAILKDLLKRVH